MRKAAVSWGWMYIGPGYAWFKGRRSCRFGSAGYRVLLWTGKLRLGCCETVFGHKDPQTLIKLEDQKCCMICILPLRPFGVSGVIKTSSNHERGWIMCHVKMPSAPPRWLMFRLPGTVSKSFSLGVEKSQLAETFRTAPKRHVWRSHGSHGRLGRRRSTSVSPKPPSPSDDFWMVWRCLTGETNTGWSSGCKFPMTSAEWIFVFAVWFGRYPWIIGWKGEGFPYQGVDSCKVIQQYPWTWSWRALNHIFRENHQSARKVSRGPRPTSQLLDTPNFQFLSNF